MWNLYNLISQYHPINSIIIIKHLALVSFSQWLECRSADRRVADLSPSQEQIPWLQSLSHQSLSLSPLLLPTSILFLKIYGKNIPRLRLKKKSNSCAPDKWMQSDEQILHVWKKEERSEARNKLEGRRVCSILNAKLENWDFIWHAAFEQKDGMPRKPKLWCKFLVIVTDSIIQSGCLSFYFRKLLKRTRTFGWKTVLVVDNPSLSYY